MPDDAGKLRNAAGETLDLDILQRSPAFDRIVNPFVENLEQAGTPGHITFEDLDAILAVETISQRAGLSLWTREKLKRYPFLHLGFL